MSGLVRPVALCTHEQKKFWDRIDRAWEFGRIRAALRRGEAAAVKHSVRTDRGLPWKKDWLP